MSNNKNDKSTIINNFSHSMARKYAQDYISNILAYKSRGEMSQILKQEVRNRYNLHGQDRMLDNIVMNVSLDPRVEMQRFLNESGKEEFGYVHVRVKDQYQNKDIPDYY
jgi:hypothetical protein